MIHAAGHATAPENHSRRQTWRAHAPLSQGSGTAYLGVCLITIKEVRGVRRREPSLLGRWHIFFSSFSFFLLGQIGIAEAGSLEQWRRNPAHSLGHDGVRRTAWRRTYTAQVIYTAGDEGSSKAYRTPGSCPPIKSQGSSRLLVVRSRSVGNVIVGEDGSHRLHPGLSAAVGEESLRGMIGFVPRHDRKRAIETGHNAQLDPGRILGLSRNPGQLPEEVRDCPCSLRER